MEYKVLKYKRLEGMFGVIFAGDDTEIWQSANPYLFSTEATMESLKKHFKGTMAAKQLNEYELVDVTLYINTKDKHRIGDWD